MSDHKLPLTPARKRALAVLATGEPARISNATDAAKRYVYWQTADWLLQHGLALKSADLQTISITEVGRAAAGDAR